MHTELQTIEGESQEVTTSPSGKKLAPYEKAIVNAEQTFAQVANGLDFNVERIFAMQALMKTDFAMKVANANPRSVRLAMLNLAATGLTLNPANAYAYLVPRDNEIKLDISYKGLIKIATDAGSIRWGKADLVHETDSFTYRGPAREPDHTANVFAKDRGEVIGVYCIARTRDGDTLTDFMDLEEIQKIRSASSAWVNGKPGRKGPWENWFGEMVKKSMIKRASKTWPYTDRSEKLFQAIEMANDAEGGYDLSGELTRKVSPNDGVGQDFSEEQITFLAGHAAALQDLYEAADDKAAGAKAAKDRLDALKLDPDEYSWVWKEFPSAMRSAMKRA